MERSRPSFVTLLDNCCSVRNKRRLIVVGKVLARFLFDDLSFFKFFCDGKVECTLKVIIALLSLIQITISLFAFRFHP